MLGSSPNGVGSNPTPAVFYFQSFAININLKLVMVINIWIILVQNER
jgi:hypothetical protein